MNNKKVELLAPAGNFACFRAAINAGADAVYLGGEKFGARAYAGNFSSEEIVDALRIAHIFGRKIYLTVNTLVKESEFHELIPYIRPLYEAGLDGVIVQDLGVLTSLGENFPGFELHASTQMTVTGVYGAEYLKKLGVCRVVPARELSLDEIRDIKNRTGLEIECFIHGAMCYAYSGQCLFSSILGGRSGNRGRCAGPCRLPYTDKRGNTVYPLSLKDMYTLSILPELIESGIDSFKIEGRMKSPEYVAGVTAMYRKYIDLYTKNPNQPYKVSASDEKWLKELYIRSDICSGYYHKHNDKTMVTLKEPGYSGSSQSVIDGIREKYISQNILLPITGHVRVRAGEPAVLTFSGDQITVTATGEIAGQAMNRPLDKAEISKRVNKLGDTCFQLTDLTVDTDNISFMPVKALNELRRLACSMLESELINSQRPGISKQNELKPIVRHKPIVPGCSKNMLCALAVTREQLLVLNDYDELNKIYVDADILLSDSSSLSLLLPEREYILVMPHIFRKRSYRYLSKYRELLNNACFSGVMVRNLEEYEWLLELGYEGDICSDYSIYAWNRASMKFCSNQFDQVTLPLELNKKELNMLESDSSLGFVVYGYIPLMYSANCVRNTLENCTNNTSGRDSIYRLTDRYKNDFSIVQNCLHCYNILYNTVPLSLHGQLDGIMKRNYDVLRLDFSIENEAQTKAVVDYYLTCMKMPDKTVVFPAKNFTNGHYKRGVE